MVIKKLGYDTELTQLDLHLCELFQQEQGCDVGQAIKWLTVDLGMFPNNEEVKETRNNRSTPRLDWKKLKTKHHFSRHHWARCMEQLQVL